MQHHCIRKWGDMWENTSPRFHCCWKAFALLGSTSIQSNSLETLTPPEWMDEKGKYCLLCNCVPSSKLMCCKRYRMLSVCHEISGSNREQVINPSPRAVCSSGAAWLIYILSIYIQMKMACLVMEIGMQTHKCLIITLFRCAGVFLNGFSLGLVCWFSLCLAFDQLSYHVRISKDVFSRDIFKWPMMHSGCSVPQILVLIWYWYKTRTTIQMWGLSLWMGWY